MDFARKQMEKYGWTDGKGLGKYENGISEALKPKLKRSVTGVGHDAAADFTEHWWSALYDKAAGNVEVKEKNGKTKKIETKDDFEITNSTWRLKKKGKTSHTEGQYQDFFVRTSVLSNGGSKTENVRVTDSDEETEKSDVLKMTDEELFAACEGRTAHKGARHGLKALGKLARIAQQEAKLLTQPRFDGYSHAKHRKAQEDVIEEMNLSPQSEATESKKKKKKKKHCTNNTGSFVEDTDVAKSTELSEMEMTVEGSVANELKEERIEKKRKSENILIGIELDEYNRNEKSKRKKKHIIADVEQDQIVNMDQMTDSSIDYVKKKKKKKTKKNQ